jgi:hypothetical protein
LYKQLITFILAAVCCTGAFAQSKTDTSKTYKPNGVNFSLGFEPIFAFNNCFKTDLEVKPLNWNFGLEVTPELYSASHILNNQHDDISGFGLGLYQKLYLNTGNSDRIMLAYGATYRHIDVTYTDEGFIPFTQNGLNYYEYKNFTDVLKNNSVLANIYISAPVADIPDSFFLDAYMGGGYKFTKQQSTYGGFRNYNTQIYDYGYKGLVFLIGIKLGLQYTVKK